MKPVTFYFTHNTTVTVPDANETVMPFDKNVFDTHGFYDSANDRPKVPTGYAGYYQINWQGAITMAGTGDNVFARLRKNGSGVQLMYAYFNGAEGERWTFTGSTILDLDEGDYLDVTLFCDRASGSSTSLGNNQTSFINGFMIGAK